MGDSTYGDTYIIIIVDRDPVLATLLGNGCKWINESGFSSGLDLTGGIINDQITKATATVLTEKIILISGDLDIEEENIGNLQIFLQVIVLLH